MIRLALASLALGVFLPALSSAQAPAEEPEPTAVSVTTSDDASEDYFLPRPRVELRVQNDRQLLRARLAEHPLGGPIAMFAIGVPVAAIFGAVAYWVYSAQDVVDCVLDECTGHPNRTAPVVLGLIGGAGLVLGVVGLVKLIIRVSARARIRQAYAEGQLSLTGGGVRLRF